MKGSPTSRLNAFINTVNHKAIIALGESRLTPTALLLGLMLFFFGRTSAQANSQLVRLAKLVIDSSQLENYKAALKEEIEASIRLEPGVLTLYAVSEKENPTHLTILEIYKDTAAYQAHLTTPHFIKYKTYTKDMVRSLELIETIPLIPGMKIR